MEASTICIPFGGESLSPKTELTPDHIMQTGLGFWASKVLLSAVEMGVFTELAGGPQEFSKLSGRLGLHPRSARGATGWDVSAVMAAVSSRGWLGSGGE